MSEDLAASLHHAITLEAVRVMADKLLAAENKKFEKAEKFLPEFLPWPEGVLQFSNTEKFYMLTPDGYNEVKSGDWIIQTTDKQRYYLRFEITE